MKTFNKILAMVLAVLTVLVMLPVNAIADGWLDVDSQTKAEDSTLTITVSAEKLAAILRENGVSKTLIKELLKDVSVDKNALSKVFTAEELFEILPKGASKGTVLCRLAEALGIRREKTIAVGDYHNDISMIRQAGLGIAVANAVDEAKALNIETLPPDELARMMNRYKEGA